MDRVGAEKWADVFTAFNGQSETDILNELQIMFPNEPDANSELAEAIMTALINSQAAKTIGRKGGKATSPAKAASSRENGKRGGRPSKAK